MYLGKRFFLYFTNLTTMIRADDILAIGLLLFLQLCSYGEEFWL